MDGDADTKEQIAKHASMMVGVIVERRVSASRWAQHDWVPIAVTTDPPGDGVAWRELSTDGPVTRFFARALPLELFRGETEGYVENLRQPRPAVFVVLRRGEELEDNDVEPFRVTVCPFEALGYAESGDEIVEGVEMPEKIGAWVAHFVADHHVDTPFKKRKNKRHRDEVENARPRGRRGRSGP